MIKVKTGHVIAALAFLGITIAAAIMVRNAERRARQYLEEKAAIEVELAEYRRNAAAAQALTDSADKKRQEREAVAPELEANEKEIQDARTSVDPNSPVSELRDRFLELGYGSR